MTEPHKTGISGFLHLPSVAVLGILLAIVASPCHAVSNDKPNIILIMADDLGYGEVGCFGQEKIKTPNLDRMAVEGLRFTQHYTGAPVCAPARCVLMTGKHSGHAFIRNNREARPEGQHPIPAEEVTIGEMLKKEGYVTGAVGKWGLGPVGSTGDPLRQGFDLFFGYNCQRHAHSYYPNYLWHNDRRIPLANDPPIPGHARLPADLDPNDPANYERYQGTDYASDHLIRAALDFIRGNHERPFFLYYPSPIPHLALHIPPEELEPYLGKWPETPFVGGHGYTPHRTPRAAYAAMVTRLDREVGQILALVKELGQDDNTLVFFTSDNGATHLNPEVDVEFFNSSGPLRGLKGSIHEGGIRMPTLARWPGRIAPSTTTDHPSAFQDVMATFADVVDADQPPGTDGISFLPTLLGRCESQKQHEYLVWEFHGYGGQQAVRLGDFKGVRLDCHRDPEGPIKLYNLATDIGETTDIAEEHPEIVQRILKIMQDEHAPSELFQFGRRK